MHSLSQEWHISPYKMFSVKGLKFKVKSTLDIF